MTQSSETLAAIPLSNDTLSGVPKDIPVPRYDRTTLTPGILHIGVGNFHRAHQAWYLHRLMQEGRALDWGIVGAGVRSYDAAMRDRLMAQDCLTTLIELTPGETTAEISGAMIDYLPVQDGNGPLIQAMADPRIRIVSLTVTEGGYFYDRAQGALDTSDPAIQADAANPAQPGTAFGAMIAALRQRRDAGHGPFTALSCDNLSGNGDILRRVLVGLAQLSDPDLAQWIETQVTFPNSMVDCIVPATGPDEISLSRDLGIADAAPVTHENYRQWVIEDNFCAGRPEWERAGAIFTQDVEAYEAMKIRILNAGHQVLANAGELLNVATIADCMAHGDIRAFFRKVQVTEIAPYVHPVPGMTPAAYVSLIERRFSNPAIRDTTRRVAFDGSSRHLGFVQPILRDALYAGGPIQGLGLVEALWARMCRGVREDGSEIAPNDPQWGVLVNAATRAQDDPMAWLSQDGLYGDLAQEPRFVAAFQRWSEALEQNGTLATLQSYVRGDV